MTTKTKKKHNTKAKQKQNVTKNVTKNENTGTEFWEYVESTKSNSMGSSENNKLKSWYENEPYNDNDFYDIGSDDIKDGCCPKWNCKNPDGSNVVMFDMGDYFICGHCYTKYDKEDKYD